MNSRTDLRKSIRTRRRALSPIEREHHAEAARKRLLACGWFRRATRIGFYLPSDGECDPVPLLAQALAMNKRCFLPVLRPDKAHSLWFAGYHPRDRLVANRYGILEPDRAAVTRIAPWSLDLVITPLTAFDIHGTRLGMGGGYYDTTFAYRLRRCFWQRPRLIGYAYDFQQVAKLHEQAWDIPLDAVLTESRLLKFQE